MRIIVMSDSHNNSSAIEKIVQIHHGADLFIHLGDGEKDVNAVILRHPELSEKFVHVSGNCDFGSLSPSVYTLTVGKHKLYASHGHLQDVKYTLDNIRKIAAANGCDIVLYGHTHNRFMQFEDGMYIMNPGSVSCPHDGNKPSYGLIDIEDAGVVTNIADL